MSIQSFSRVSSHIAGAEYDDETHELTIEFADGSRYAYGGVPPETFRAFREAPSAGQFFHRQIKRRFSYSGL